MKNQKKLDWKKWTSPNLVMVVKSAYLWNYQVNTQVLSILLIIKYGVVDKNLKT
jgi:hypothetical protein